LAKSTNHKVPHYAIFSILVTSSLFGPNILLSTLFSNILKDLQYFKANALIELLDLAIVELRI
jgi:hypothetical protein